MSERSSAEPPLAILYQDSVLLAVNKPSGMVVHRGWANDAIVAMTMARDAVGQYVYPVHRLDRGTSGVLLFALDPETAAKLQRQFADRSVGKRYRALVRGLVEESIEIDHPVPKSEGGARVEAQTSVRPIFSRQRYTWLEAVPRTGRLHQVRRHLKHISHPIIGDVRYGKGEHNRYFRSEHELHRLALHCIELRLVHPDREEALTIRAPLPPDLAAPLAHWGLEAHLETSG